MQEYSKLPFLALIEIWDFGLRISFGFRISDFGFQPGMTSRPIIQRELLVRSRARATYWLRFAVALTGLLICSHQLMRAAFVTTPAAFGPQCLQRSRGRGFRAVLWRGAVGG